MSATQIVDLQRKLGSPILKAMADGKMPGKYYVPVAQVPEGIAAAVGVETSVVRLSQDSLNHIFADHPERGLKVEDLRAAIGVLRTGTMVPDPKGSIIALGESAKSWWRVVAKPVVAKNEWWIASFHRKSEKSARDYIRRNRTKGRVIE